MTQNRRAALAVALAALSCAAPLAGQGAPAGRPGAGPVSAATIRVSVGPNVHVGWGAGSVPQLEPHLAVHPSDPRIMIAAAMAFPVPGRGAQAYVYATRDGGRRWTRVPVDTLGGRNDDPWLAFGPDGTAYLSHLDGPRRDVAVRRSGDGGRTWSPAAAVPRGEAGDFDFPKLVVDGRSGSGTVYVVASQSGGRAFGRGVYPVAVHRSVDRARTFAGPVHVLPNNFNNQNGDAVVLPDGGLLVSFQEIEIGGEFLKHPRLWAARSPDGGRSFGAPSLVAEEYVADSPRLAADTGAGPFHGRVYATWYQGAGERGQYLARSTDGGRTWSRPVRFAADTAALHSPMIAVGRGGVVGVAWMRPEGDQPQRRCYRFVFTASSDGGETFLPPGEVASEPSCNDTPRNQVEFGGGRTTLVRRWRDGGDYHGLAALPSGGFQALWADSRTGVFQPWTARIDVEGMAAAPGGSSPTGPAAR
jgi:hypothetical protein